MYWRGTFGFKRKKLKGYWRKLHNEELQVCTTGHRLLGQSNQQERDRWLCGTNGSQRNA